MHPTPWLAMCFARDLRKPKLASHPGCSHVKRFSLWHARRCWFRLDFCAAATMRTTIRTTATSADRRAYRSSSTHPHARAGSQKPGIQVQPRRTRVYVRKQPISEYGHGNSSSSSTAFNCTGVNGLAMPLVTVDGVASPDASVPGAVTGAGTSPTPGRTCTFIACTHSAHRTLTYHAPKPEGEQRHDRGPLERGCSCGA